MTTNSPLNLDDIRRRPDFTAEERDGRVLVKPSKIKHLWSQDEICLRSVLTDSAGAVLSAGFPKFFNYGENQDDSAEVDRLMAGDVVFTEKLDGSLIVRSVIAGAVHLRTRGNYDLGDMFGHVRAFAAEKHPDVLDPSVGDPSASYLFEYTAPDNQIVLAYRERALTFLGRVCHTRLAFFDDQSPFSTPVVARVPLEAESARHAQTAIMSRERTEGVVAWLRRQDGSIHLSKFKSAWYLRAHALKSFATADRIRDYAWANGFNTVPEFVNGLMRDGVDYESAVDKVPLFETFIRDRAARLDEVDAARCAAAAIAGLPDRGAKARALKADPALERFFHQLIYFVLGESDKADETREAYGLGLSSMQLKSLKATRAEAAKVVLDVDAAMRDDG